MTPLHILGLCGSLRSKSMNGLALQAAGRLMSDGMRLQVHDFSGVPLYNQDVHDQGIPAAVEQLRDAVLAADGVLIASPEYNFSISGVLKNAIDWLSRITPQPFKGKPIAIMSATTGPIGGGRSQYELRKVLGSVDALVLVKPEVFMGQAQNRFDAQGQLADEATIKAVQAQMVAFEAWIRRLQAGAA
jgi:chromate reductase, NAD(P)H dehydrogenase (quinone)